MKQNMTISALFLSAACICVNTQSLAASSTDTSTTQKIEQGTENAVKKTAEGTKNVLEGTGKAIEHVAKGVGKATTDGFHAIEKGTKDMFEGSKAKKQ